MAQIGPLLMSTGACQSLFSARLSGLALSVGRTGDETLEEGLVAQVLIVLLEVLLSGCDELDGGELEAGRTLASIQTPPWQ